jgi:Component of IIS longevity pathway SMK-1
LEDEAGLAAMHTAVRGAIMLNDTGLLEAMLSEENVMDVIGALE